MRHDASIRPPAVRPEPAAPVRPEPGAPVRPEPVEGRAAIRPSERGVALALVLVVAVLLSITVMAVLQTVGLRFISGETTRHRDAAFYTSEAGLQWTWYKLTRKIPPFDDQSLAGWPVNTVKTDTVTIFGDDADPANDRVVTVSVTRISAGPGPKQFSIETSADIPIGAS